MDPSLGALRRVIGVPGAMLLGLGSILGTGVFVSLGLAAGVAGSGILGAVLLAGLVATANGLSSAQLAAAHPVSGGTYEYGYRFLTPTLGFVAGWTFVCAKTASAASAALGLSGYALAALGVGTGGRPLAITVIAAVTALVAGGVERTSRVNAVVVSTTLVALVALVVAGLPTVALRAPEIELSTGSGGVAALLEATALVFVAYTGYARIATLGEEVREPERAIPRAVVLTLLVTMALYLSVAGVALGVLGAARLAAETARSSAPLEAVARELAVPGLRHLVGLGAATAMLGVLLNLVLGNSRMILAMARRGDLPAGLAAIEVGANTPRRAVVAAGALVACVAMLGDLETAWTFSAFTVLVYYAITNLAALRLGDERGRFPRALAWVGLASCLALAFWIEPRVWSSGLAIIAAGLVARKAMHRAEGRV